MRYVIDLADLADRARDIGFARRREDDAVAVASQGFPAVLSLAALDGANGSRFDGTARRDYSGTSVSSAGDVNGDGFDDLLIGASGSNAGPGRDAGASYVVFGKAEGFGVSFDLADLNGANGFRIVGVDASDYSGRSVSAAGDVNGDGFDDIIIGAPYADPGGDSYAGESYVVFGKAGGLPASVDLATLNGGNGFSILGVDASDYSGRVASAGDVNGDGFDDIIIGASGADPGGDSGAGESYVVFGKAAGFAANIDLGALDGGNGFRIDGIDASDFSGVSVSSAGDINGDGFDDIIIGASGADALGDADSGESYVVFGKAGGFAPSLDLATLDGSNGFRLDGNNATDLSGGSVSAAGDVNGDGYDDIVIGARQADPDGRGNSGESYVVFGKAGGFTASFFLAGLDGSNGFRIDGTVSSELSGTSVAGAGDVNADGFDDVLIGTGAGRSFVVFGKAGGFAPSIDLAALDGTNGFRIDGAGSPVSAAGDVNHDGFDDIILGAPGGDADGIFNAGQSFVVYGQAPDEKVRRIGSVAGQTIYGGAFDDKLLGRGGDDMLVGGGGDDTLIGGVGDDVLIGAQRKDTLTGEQGADIFRFGPGDSGVTLTFADTITDFRQAQLDRIDVSLIDANRDTPEDDIFDFIGTAAFSGTAGELRYEVSGGDTLVTGDADGDGDANFTIRLVGEVALTESDFILTTAAAFVADGEAPMAHAPVPASLHRFDHLMQTDLV